MSLNFSKAGPRGPVEISVDDRADARLYRNLTNRLGGIPPTAFMLKFMGQAASQLARRRTSDKAIWRAFREMVTNLYPKIPSHRVPIIVDQNKLVSVPEQIVYKEINRRLPTGVALYVHPTPIETRKFIADFSVRSQTGKVVYIEVVGSLGRLQPPVTDFGELYTIKLVRKLAIYERAGLEFAVIYVDEVCAPNRLKASIERIFQRVDEMP